MMIKLLARMAAANNLPLEAAEFAARFAAAQIAALPPVPRFAVYFLAALFKLHSGLHGVFHAGAPLPPARWRTNAPAPCRDFILLCDSLLLFAAYSAAAQDKKNAAVITGTDAAAAEAVS